MKTRLELAAIAKAYGARHVLNGAWVQVKAGEAVGLIGANGAGKTTLLRIAAGLVTPDAGLVRVFDASSVGVRYFGGERTLPPDVSARHWARWFNIDTADRRLLGQLSRGSRQLFGLRTILSAQGAELILLDEPWEGLDPNGATWLTDALTAWRSRDAALLISSHRLHDLSSACSRFVVLEDGRCREMEMRDDGRQVEELAQVFSRR